MKPQFILAIVLFIFIQQLYADCPHCFTIVRVNIVYDNGTSEIAYVKFFRSYELDNNGVRPNENENIRHYFPDKKDTIQIIDSIYKIKDLPYFIDKDKTRKASLNIINGIFILKWTKITGTCNMPNLPQESIQRILNSKTLISNFKIFNVHDEKYIYTDSALTRREFDFFIENSYNYSDVSPSVITNLRSKGIKINESKNLYPGKSELIEALESYLDQIDNKLLIISDLNTNEDIDEYFKIFAKYLKTKKYYHTLILSYLNSGAYNDLINFINSDVVHDYYKPKLINRIHKTDNAESEIIKTSVYLIKNAFIISIDPKLEDQFDKIIQENNIIVLVVSWD